MTALFVAVVLAGVPAHENYKCHKAECHAWRSCNAGSTRACIRRAALKYRVSEAMLRRKAWCESRFNPRAINRGSGASGLFQFLPSTWRTTPYGRRPIFAAKWNALAAGWMHARGRGAEWSCQ
jgi:soluble lytic murein transglycosylase-like protein